MTELPFLVVHGALVWKVVLLALVGATVWRWWRSVGRPMLVTITVVATTLWGGALCLVGHVIVPDRPGHAVDHIAPFGRAAIAAALPGSRHDALWTITSSDLTHDEAGLQLGLAIDRFKGKCESGRLEAVDRLDDALEAARQCGSQPEVVGLLLELGRYDEAASTIDPISAPQTATRAFIAAGRWRDAAKASDALLGSAAVDTIVAARCFNGLLAYWAGDREALDRLALEPSDECRVMVAAERGESVELSDPSTSVAHELAWRLGMPVRLFENSRFPEPGPDTWLTPHALLGSTTTDADYIRQLEAIRAIQYGRFDQAAKYLSSPPSEAGAFSHRLLLGELAIRSGRELSAPPEGFPPDRFLEFDETLRRGIVSPKSGLLAEVWPETCPLEDAVRAAVAGDGGPLAQVFRTCTVYWKTLFPWLPAVLPLVTRHRVELAEALRLYRSDLRIDGSPLIGRLSDFSLYRDIARLIGDAAEADRWQQILERHAQLLSDRRRVIALAIWDQLR